MPEVLRPDMTYGGKASVASIYYNDYDVSATELGWMNTFRYFYK